MKLPTDPVTRPHPNILLPQHASVSVQAHVSDFCENLRHREAYCLGFIPAVAYDEAQRRGRLFVELENDEPCGFILWTKRARVLKIAQCAIVEDERRLKHATHLVANLLNQKEALNAKQLRLRVAHDLDANHFWQSIGCEIWGTQPGGKTWGRTINLYRMPIANRMEVAHRLIHANIELSSRRLANPKVNKQE